MSYKIIKKEIYLCHCEKCSYNWESSKLPRACAKCKQTGWNRAKKKK